MYHRYLVVQVMLSYVIDSTNTNALHMLYLASLNVTVCEGPFLISNVLGSSFVL